MSHNKGGIYATRWGIVICSVSSRRYFPDFSVLAQWCIGLRVTSLTFDFQFSDAENCWIMEGQLMRARGEI